MSPLSIMSLSTLGQARSDFQVLSHALPPATNLDGLLGLDFFRGQVLTIDFQKGEITLDPGIGEPHPMIVEAPAPPSPVRAWLFLVGFAFRRQARVRQMVGIAVGLLMICLLLVMAFTVSAGWDRLEWRINRIKPYTVEHVAGGMARPAIDQSEYMDRIRQETRPLAVFRVGSCSCCSSAF